MSGRKINNPGLVEVPLGTTLGKLVFDIGGGIPNGKKFKGALLGALRAVSFPSMRLTLRSTTNQ